VSGDDADQDHSGEDSDDEKLDEDDFDDIVDRFESSYNFRFEEP
jgi:protein KRI1